MRLHVRLSLAAVHLFLVELNDLSWNAMLRLIEDSQSLSSGRAFHVLLLVIRECRLRVFEA